MGLLGNIFKSTEAKLVTIRCPLCNADSFSQVYPDTPSRIVQCRECDLVFFNPQPSIDYLKEFYSSQNGYMQSILENLQSFEKDPSAWKQTADFIVDKLGSHLPVETGQRILDVGCAYGFFLLFAKERGFQAHGIEISSETSRYAKDHGVNVANTTLLESRFERNYFHFITMNNVLEHTLNPVAELARAYELLQQGGIIFVAVPNFDSLVSKADNFYWKMKSWPNHLFYFTPKSLAGILEKVGFTVVEIFTHMGESDYSHDVRVIRERLLLTKDEDIRQAIELLWKLHKGQELVILARKG